MDYVCLLKRVDQGMVVECLDLVGCQYWVGLLDWEGCLGHALQEEPFLFLFLSESFVHEIWTVDVLKLW